MNAAVSRQVAAGFALAVLTVALGAYLSLKLASPDVLRMCYALAAVALLKSVFTWGAARGFPIRENGRLHGAHLVRNLTMALIAAPVVLLAAAPLLLIAFLLAR